MAKLLKAALYRPLQKQAVREKPALETCPLGCCSATQGPTHLQTVMLLQGFLNFKLWRSEQKTRRREMVELAAAVTHSIETIQTTQAVLERMVPSIDPSKLIRMWRVLARPVTNLRILSQIARLLPHFQNTIFLHIPCPAPLKLRDDQVPTIWEAWEYLGLPVKSDRRIPRALARKSGDFKRACRSDLFIHCEVQLLTRYEADISLSPTSPYFGCSKKTCFLCEEVLALSPMKVRTRGRHGQCHPQWGVPLSTSEGTKKRLRELCRAIKQKILDRLEPRGSTPLAINQSSAVSDLKTSDMRELVQQRRDREAAERKSQELREQRQIL